MAGSVTPLELMPGNDSMADRLTVTHRPAAATRIAWVITHRSISRSRCGSAPPPLVNMVTALLRKTAGERLVPVGVSASHSAQAEIASQWDSAKANRLTARESEIITCVASGLRNAEVAERLSISEATVNFHIKNIVDKLRANDRTHAVIIAVRRGLMQL